MTYKEAVQELLRRVENDEPIALDDDTTPGSKDTTCHWGMCSPSMKGVKKKENRKCPFDVAPEYDKYGCFWRCMLFQGHDGYSRRKHTKIEATLARGVLSVALVQLENEENQLKGE